MWIQIIVFACTVISKAIMNNIIINTIVIQSVNYRSRISFSFKNLHKILHNLAAVWATKSSFEAQEFPLTLKMRFYQTPIIRY